MTKIVILGAGEIGLAIKTLLQSKKSVQIDLWDKDKTKVKNQKALKQIIPEADFVFLAVAAKHLRSASKSILSFLNSKTIVLSLAKGVEPKTNQLANQILKQKLPGRQPFALLSGPMIAEELCLNANGFAVVATKSTQAFNLINDLFADTKLLLTYSKDLHGVALCGVLKNIYAMSLGVAAGLNWCNNERGWLISQASKEIQDLIRLFGGQAQTFFTPAGLADLLATSLSPHSNNFQYGYSLVKRQTTQPGEGYFALDYY
jgi:glycerol-3-phosphate dehydrogenase (NAD(P)+)